MRTRASLTRHGKEVSSVFDLLGRDENDLTAALAFTLACSPRLLHLILQRLDPRADSASAAVRLETRDDRARTDLEIDTGSHLLIIEAKRGWLVPEEIQLTKYAPRVAARGNDALVSLSAANAQSASLTLPKIVEDVLVIHLSWDEVRLDLAAARGAVRGQERAWLDEFHDYLRKAIKMREPADSWTYCVAISTDRPGGGSPRTFRDFVTNEGCYFHPYGKGWPRTPEFPCLPLGAARSSESTVLSRPKSSPASKTAGQTSPKTTTPPARTPSTRSGLSCQEPPSVAVRPTVPSVGGSSWTSS